MAIDPGEVARFLAALARLPPEGIRRRLDKYVIIRPWKRDLAEADLERRASAAGHDGSTPGAGSARRNRRDLSRRVWAITLVVIAAGMAVLWISVLELWH